jgi:hypothetical protein
MIEGYSCRKLSVDSDKFPGISGLASEYSYLLSDQYVADLWRNNLAEGLSWRWLPTEKATRPTKERMTFYGPFKIYGPSWSWAKMDSPVTWEIVRA